jgi:CRP-like cAMP-binding protein
MARLDKSFIRGLGAIALFAGMDETTLSEMVSDARAERAVFSPGQTIYTPDLYRKSLAVLLNGRAEVRKTSAGHTVILNRLTAPALFGAAILFQDGARYVSEITALTACTILFLPQELLTDYMRRDFTLVENYLRFLSERIRFLNRKIDGFTQASAEGRLAWYLLDLAGQEAGEVCLPVSLQKLASVLNLGRASLYRALDSLIESRLIERDGRLVKIIDKNGLQALCQ